MLIEVSVTDSVNQQDFHRAPAGKPALDGYALLPNVSIETVPKQLDAANSFEPNVCRHSKLDFGAASGGLRRLVRRTDEPYFNGVVTPIRFVCEYPAWKGVQANDVAELRKRS